jgi:hypothetical protein
MFFKISNSVFRSLACFGVRSFHSECHKKDRLSKFSELQSAGKNSRQSLYVLFCHRPNMDSQECDENETRNVLTAVAAAFLLLASSARTNWLYCCQARYICFYHNCNCIALAFPVADLRQRPHLTSIFGHRAQEGKVCLDRH